MRNSLEQFISGILVTWKWTLLGLNAFQKHFGYLLLAGARQKWGVGGRANSTEQGQDC